MQTLKRTLEFGSLKIEIEVRGESGFDGYVERFLFRRIYELVMGKPYTADDWWTVETQAMQNLVPVINRTVTVTGIPLTWPHAKSEDKDLCGAWDYLKVIPGAVWEGWQKAIDDVDQPPGDSDLLPPEELTSKQKKAQS